MKEVTLLILAAGMSSRFGRSKQVEPVGPNDEFIIDYSIYDAIRAGFSKIVFVIKPESAQIFRDKITKKYEDKIKVEFAFQDSKKDLKKYNLPSDRIKPLGTTHAILCAKDLINEPFVIINADDFYGYDAYKDAIEFLEKTDFKENGAILYKIGNTLSKNGSVKRGICEIKNDELVNAVECNVYEDNNKILASSLTGNFKFEVEDNNACSMNMFVLQPSIFALLEQQTKEYFKQNSSSTSEALIIESLFSLIKAKKITIHTQITNAKWFGMTYQQDKQLVVDNIKQLVDSGKYPKKIV